MADYTIPKGTTDWDVPLNADLVDIDSRITANSTAISSNSTSITTLQNQVITNLDNLVYLVDNHGAAGNGVTDDAPAIQALINSVPTGATIQFGPKKYGLSNALTLPPYIRLEGPQLDRDNVTADNYPGLFPLAGFPDAAVLILVDKATGGYATENRDVTVTNLNIVGSNLTSETVAGIQATGFVHGVQLSNLSVQGMTNHSINLVSNGSGNPYSWYLSNVQLLGTGGGTSWNGFNMIGTDHQFTNCRTLNIRGHGYQFTGGANNQINNCRAEWSALSGFYITGSWGTSQGSGGCIMNGCSTDRNSQYGILIDSTGNASHLIDGVMLRRDGRNGFPGSGGGGFAGLRVSSATTPVVVGGITVYPGVNDDGTGTNSPERGISVANSTYVSINDGYLHADTLPWHDGAGNTALYRGPLVGTATGTTSAPTRSLVGANAMPGPFTLTQGGYQVIRGASTNTLIAGQVNGDTQNRVLMDASGIISWGPGNATSDVSLQRSSANNLQVATGNLSIGTVGRGLRVAEGSNAKSGTATLTAGSVVVSNTSVTANSRIQLTSQADGGTPGFLRVSARTPGTSFTITSSSGTDTSTVAYFIVEP